MPKTYKFTVSITGDVAASEGALPIYDSDNRLVGGFTLLSGDVITGYVAGQESPVALLISTNSDFYLRPVQGSNGLISHAIISEWDKKGYKVRAYE